MEIISIVYAEYQQALEEYEKASEETRFLAWLDVAAKAKIVGQEPPPKPQNSSENPKNDVEQAVPETFWAPTSQDIENTPQPDGLLMHDIDAAAWSIGTSLIVADHEPSPRYIAKDPPSLPPSHTTAAAAAAMIRNNPPIPEEIVPRNPGEGTFNYLSYLHELLEGDVSASSLPHPRNSTEVRSLRKLIIALSEIPENDRKDNFTDLYFTLNALVPRQIDEYA